MKLIDEIICEGKQQQNAYFYLKDVDLTVIFKKEQSYYYL